MKRFNLFLMALAIFIPAVSMAQDKLTRIESRDIARRANDSELSFHDQEMTRMLNPKKRLSICAGGPQKSWG